jgi:hypothetical protein
MEQRDEHRDGAPEGHRSTEEPRVVPSRAESRLAKVVPGDRIPEIRPG